MAGLWRPFKPHTDKAVLMNDENEVLCYVCTLPLRVGDPIVRLHDEDGHDWVVHQDCMSEFEKATPDKTEETPE